MNPQHSKFRGLHLKYLDVQFFLQSLEQLPTLGPWSHEVALSRAEEQWPRVEGAAFCLFSTNPARVLRELWAVNSMREGQGHWGENSSINTDTSSLLYNISKHLIGGKKEI